MPVLMVGNSLLLYGVDLKQLQQLTPASLRVYPIFMEGTGYYDWLYGLRRLFRLGARPQVVVVGLEVYSAMANGVWDETPMLLFDTRDVLGLAADLRLDRTATSDLLLSHWSVFWAMRSFFRQRIISHLVPHYDDLAPFIRLDDLALPHDEEFQATVTSRVRHLRELCEANGAKMILVIPPTLGSANANREMAIASEKAGVEAMVPIDPTLLSAGFYQPDYIQLNSRGAGRLTSAFAVDLPKTIMAATHRPI